MTVADVGTGTGILARFAVRAGGKKVYAIEQHEEILLFAQRINAVEGADEAIELIHGDSRESVLKEPVDVIVAELIGGIGNDEAMSPILEDARERFLKPGGRVIPNRVDVFICPVNAPEAHKQIPSVYQVDVIVPREEARPPFRAYYQILGLSAEQLLSEYQRLDSIDLMAHTELAYRRQFSFECKSDSTFSGFAAWFKAQLSDNEVLDTSPWSPLTAWGQAFFAVREQAPVRKGDEVELTFSAIVPHGSDRPFYVWEGTVRRGEKILLDYQETNQLPNVVQRAVAAS